VISCETLSPGEVLWKTGPGPGEQLLFPPVQVERKAAGRDLPDSLLALSGGGEGAILRVIEAGRGGLLARAQLGKGVVLPPVVIDELAVIARSDSLLAFSLPGLSLDKSSPAWEVSLPAGGVVALSGDENGHCFLLGESLAALDIETGELLASLPIGGLALTDRLPGIRVHRGLVYLLMAGAGLGSREGGITCFEMIGSSFEKRWERPGRVEADSAVFFAGKLGFLDPDNKLAILDASTGEPLDLVDYSPARPLGLTADLSACYVVLSTGAVSRFSHIRGREDWRVTLGPPKADLSPGLSQPLLRAGKVLVAGQKRVFLLSESAVEGGPSGWVGARADGGRSGNLDQRQGPIRGRILWRKKMPAAGPAEAGLVIPLGDRIITFAEHAGGGRLFCLEHTGEVVDSMDLAAMPAGAVATPSRLVLSLGGDAASRGAGELLGLGISGLKLRQAWARPVQGPGRGGLCLVDGGVVVAAKDALLMANPADGTTAWERRDLGQATAVCSLGRDLFAAQGGLLHLLDAASGETLREFPGSDQEITSVAGSAGILYITRGKDQAAILEAVSRDRGELLWSRRLEDHLGLGASSSEKLLLVADRGKLAALDPGTGKELREFLPSRAWNSPPALALGMMVAVDGDRVLALDPLLGEEIWSLELGAGQVFSSVSIIDGRVYLRSPGELVCAGGEEAD
jgi:outer membrane protein assembly factor BamB